MTTSAIDLNYYEDKLTRRLNYLTNRLENIEDQLDDPKSADWSEHATEAEGDQVMEELGLSGLQEIRAINAALGRIKSGNFGECVKCGEAILSERLETLPHTPFCRNCAAGKQVSGTTARPAR